MKPSRQCFRKSNVSPDCCLRLPAANPMYMLPIERSPTIVVGFCRSGAKF